MSRHGAGAEDVPAHDGSLTGAGRRIHFPGGTYSPPMRPRLTAAVALFLAFTTAASVATVAAVLGPWTVGTAAAQPPIPNGSGELALALRRLLVVGNVLYVAAHPDDENTAMLSWLARGRLVRAAYLSLTRGDGGQNLIGAERGEEFGVIRTEELLAARRIDGARQYFTRAIDFGYSKSPGETMAIWGHDEVLSDVVRVVRTFRPDVIVTRFPTNGDGGHGQHTASALLAEEAFTAAADPARFPEQITRDGLAPWATRRLFWNVFRVNPDQRDPKLPKLLAVDLGAYNPFLGRSYSEIAAESRSMHKSQGFGSPERRGTLLNYLEPRLGAAASGDLMDGIDTTWNRLPGGAQVIPPLEEAVRRYRPERPAEVIPPLVEALRRVRKLAPSAEVREKEGEILEAIRAAAGLWTEAISAHYAVTPGSEVTVSVVALNRSDAPLTLRRVEASWGAKPAENLGRLESNRPVKAELTVHVPETTDETNPYWLDAAPGRGLFSVADPKMIGRPESRPTATVRFTLEAEGEPLVYEIPVQYRSTDPVMGERYRPLEVVPKVSLHLAGGVAYFADRKPKELLLTLKGGRKGVAGTAGLRVPAGWTVSASQPFSLREEGEEMKLRFTVTPPEGAAAGLLRAEATVEGTTISHDLLRIDYPHLAPIVLTPPAEARLVRQQTTVKARRVGYITGSGDDVPEALRQLGLEVALLSDEDLASGSLGSFDAIVAGVRAYNTRKRLAALQPRLMDYVRNGGTYVVQYNTTQELLPVELGPFPLTLSRDRVTVEEAPVTFLKADPVLSSPNRIGPGDFDGWVQERGLYFPGSWDARYEALLSMADPGEKASEGALLVARYGKGTYVYTGLAFFRQLPAGVPGAYRLLANLVSAGKK